MLYLGIILALLWDKTKNLFKDKSIFQRGLRFGVAYWLIATLPGMFMSYSSFQVSLVMVLSWSISGLIQAIIAGWIYVKMNP